MGGADEARVERIGKRPETRTFISGYEVEVLHAFHTNCAEETQGNHSHAEKDEARKPRSTALYDPTHVQTIWVMEGFVHIGVPLLAGNWETEIWQADYRGEQMKEGVGGTRKRPETPTFISGYMVEIIHAFYANCGEEAQGSHSHAEGYAAKKTEPMALHDPTQAQIVWIMEGFVKIGVPVLAENW